MRRLLLFLLLLCALPSFAQTPELFQSFGGLANDTDAQNGFRFHAANPVPAGYAVVFGVSYPNAVAAPTITDDTGSNTYVVALSCSNTALATPTAHSIIYALNVAANTQNFTFTFSAPVLNMHFAYTSFYNVATSSAVDGTAVCTANQTPANNTPPNIRAGSITTTANGDLIYNYVIDEGDGSANGKNLSTSITFGSGFTGLYGETSQNSLAQFEVQGTAGAINPGSTVAQTTHDPFASLAIAFKSATSGTPPAAGIRILRTTTTAPNQTSFPFTMPCSGNLLVINPNSGGATNDDVTAISSTPSNTWTRIHPTTDSPILFHADNATCSKSLSGTMTVVAATTGNMTNMYDITGAAISPIDTGWSCPAPSSSGGAGTGSCINSGSVAVATTTNQSRVATDTTVTIAAAGGIANNDFLMWDVSPNVEIVQVTAGGGTTTLTISRHQRGSTAVSHASGTNLVETNFFDAPDITPSTANGLVLGGINQGTGPMYDAVNQTFDTVWGIGATDADRMAFGDGHSHVYNSGIGALNFGYMIGNDGTLSTWFSMVTAFKAAPTRRNRAQIITALVEGDSLRSIVRVIGAAMNTVLKLLADVGMAVDVGCSLR